MHQDHESEMCAARAHLQFAWDFFNEVGDVLVINIYFFSICYVQNIDEAAESLRDSVDQCLLNTSLSDTSSNESSAKDIWLKVRSFLTSFFSSTIASASSSSFASVF